MKKKGFTLIELLAVIVVLAIIALIATPIVTNTIEEVEKGSIERGANNYIKQVETTIALQRMNGIKIKDGKYIINQDGNLQLNGKVIKVEMNGVKPTSGKIIIKNSEIDTKTIMKIDKYSIKYDEEKESYVVTDAICVAVDELSTQEYYDVTLEQHLKEQTGVLARNDGPYAYGVEYTCDLGDDEEKTFYVLDVNDDDVSLIMNMNIDENGKATTNKVTIQWSADGSNHKDDESQWAITAKTFLHESTIGWTKLEQDQISLPTAYQVAVAGGDTEWTDTHYSGQILPAWLYENITTSGYWTSTPHFNSDLYVWYVYYKGNFQYPGVTHSGIGVRPVITISKAQLG